MLVTQRAALKGAYSALFKAQNVENNEDKLILHGTNTEM
jgi:hypothetical protein